MRFSRGTLFFCALLLQSVVAPAGAATLVGKVSVAGLIPAPPPLPVFKNRSFCGAAVKNETLLIGKLGGLQNAVVLLAPKRGVVSLQPMKITLDNQRCAFVPHVQIAPAGSELLLKNSDAILHTVHARIGKETLFNVGLPRWRQVVKPLDRAGVMRIDCDVLHTWMSAVIVVATTPYFAVSDENGEFRIDGLPAGDYEAQVWHERLGGKIAALRIADAGENRLDAVFSVPSGR